MGTSNTIGARLRFLRQHISSTSNETQTQFAQRFGLTRAAYSMYELDKVRPKDGVLYQIATVCGADFNWLKDGNGKPYIKSIAPSSVHSNAPVRKLFSGKNEFAKQFIRALSQLNEEEWQTIKKIVDAIQENESPA